ncbi:MAG: DUF3568 family protein [Deltaproteobacteria bacterium]|nr:DUF3568 family protein [Deltaproteobacteria bacterium]
MMRMKQMICVLFCLMSAGCAALVFLGGAAAGVAGYKYYEGSLEVIYESPFMETWDAALRALDRMGIEVTNKKHDLTAGKISAMRADDKEINISFEYKSQDETMVTIRVGILGDESASNTIKEEIRKELFE